MDPLVTSSLIKGGISLLGGLFSKKKREPTPEDNLVSQAAGARHAAKKHGFNPLTMLQYGNPAGAMSSGGGAPLASIDMITGGLMDIADVFTGKAAQDAATMRLERDLAALRLEQAKSEVVAFAPSAVGQMGTSPLGGRSVTLKEERSAPSDMAATPPVRPITIAGEAFKPTGDFSDQEAMETRYGELVSLPFGVAAFAYDSGANFGRWMRRHDGMVQHENGHWYHPMPEAYSRPKAGVRSPNTMNWDNLRNGKPF